MRMDQSAHAKQHLVDNASKIKNKKININKQQHQQQQ